MSMRRLSYIPVALAALLLAVSCNSDKLGPTIPIPEDQGEGSAVDAPGVRIIDVKTDAFTANWKMVPDALEYEYVFDDGEVCVTKDTTLTFTGLAEDSEHVFRICTVPRVESGRLRSDEVVVHVLTSLMQPLDAPALSLGTVSTATTIISWGVTPEADSYQWELGERNGTTNKTFLVFQGLLENVEYTLKVKSIPADGSPRAESGWAEISFVPVRDGSEKMYFSNFQAISDAISFNVYANKGQYYWYDLVSAVKYNASSSDPESYAASLKAGIDAKVDALVESGMSRQEAYASVLKSGSASVFSGAYASLSYVVTAFGLDLAGNIVTDITTRNLTTPATLDSDGPHYEDAGDWFTQSMMLGSTDATSTTYIYFNRKGTGVTSVQYLLYTTSKFEKRFGTVLDQVAVNEIKSTVRSDGSVASADALSKVNTSAGYTAGYSGREPGTSYTLIALATNEKGATKLVVNSIRTRSTTEKNNWISYSLRSSGTDTFTIRVIVDSCSDAVAGGFYCAPLADVTSQYSRAEYRQMVIAEATPFTDAQIAEIASSGYATVTISGLTSGVQYFAGSYVTNSAGDTTVLTSSVKTK